jgi:hypothetical protein
MTEDRRQRTENKALIFIMLELLFKYYGIDWTAIFTMFLFMYYIGSKKRFAFIFGIISSAAWVIFAIMAQSVASIIANSVMILLNIRGYFYWKQLKNRDNK